MACFFYPRALPLLALSTLLVACGGEREEPFNPPEESDEFRERISLFGVYSDTSVNDENRPDSGTYPDGKRLQVIDNVDDFDTITNAYLAQDDGVDPQNFEDGQVLLYDGGWVDESRCEQSLEMDRMEAHFITEEEDLVEVTVVYRRNEADEDAVCNEEELSRSFDFRYIDSRADIVFVEEVRGISEDNNGSSSRSSSSNSNSSSSANDGF